MDWSHASVDEIDRGFDHFGGLTSAGQAELCALVQAADVSQSWMRDGARTLADWVSVRLRVRPETATRLVRVARRLTDLPILTERFAAGDLSLDQVDALSRMATADTEVGLISEALGLNNAQLDRLARRANPRSQTETAEAHRLQALWIQRRLDEAGGRLTADLPNAELEMVETGLRARADRMPVNPDTGVFDPYPQRMADALVETFATSGDQTTITPTSQVVVYAELEALTTETEGVSELTSGNLIGNDTARWLACDCVVETVITDGSQVIGVGRTGRTIPGWLRRLVHHRDGGQCRFPGCNNTNWLQVHHIIHWSQGGTTDLENLILLCGFHHRFLHEKNWHITRSDDSFVFRRPDWAPYPQPKTTLHPRLAALVGRSP